MKKIYEEKINTKCIFLLELNRGIEWFEEDHFFTILYSIIFPLWRIC
jgi:hypothetical protein